MRIRILLLASLLASMMVQPLRATAQGLSATGPWIVYLSASDMDEVNARSAPYGSTDRLLAINPDGSGTTTLAEGQIYAQLTPNQSGLLAYLSYDKGNAFYTNLTLNIIKLPTGGLVRAIPLVSLDIAAKIASGEPGSDVFDPVWAITSTDNGGTQFSLSWSPDGTTLAFIGAQDGPSADLYTYTPATDTILRLTDGPTQGIRPSWSPDGRYIVHLAVEGFGSGAGYSLYRMFAASADGREIKTLYDPNGGDRRSGDEELVGWLDDTHFVVSTWFADCGLQQMRLFDLSTLTEQSLWESCYESAALDPVSRTILIARSSDFAAFDGTGIEAGLYLLANGSETKISDDGDFHLVVWSAAAGAFFAVPITAWNEGTPVVRVDALGNLQTLTMSVLPKAVNISGGLSLAWLDQDNNLMIAPVDSTGMPQDAATLATDAAEEFVVVYGS